MKRKLFKLCILFAVMICFTGLPFHYSGSIAKANAITAVNKITITQKPTKTNYSNGESLDLAGMVVQASYNDGTTATITDYTVQGFDSNRQGMQTITISYQNCTATLDVMVGTSQPTNVTKVTNVTSVGRSSSEITLAWDIIPDATRYEIYEAADASGNYILNTSTSENRITLKYGAGTIRNYRVCAIRVIDGTEQKGEFSDTCTAATTPEAVTGLEVKKVTSSTVELSWSTVAGATSYLVYRANASEEEFTFCGTVNTTTFTDEKLIAGQGYQYKVCAFTYEKKFYGSFSDVVITSTNLTKMILKAKPGDQKIRITWPVSASASSYDIYMKEESGEFSLLTTIKKKKTNSYVAEGLTTDRTYSFYAVAHRTFEGETYDSDPSDPINIQLAKISDTSTVAKMYPTKEKFMQSSAYKSIPYFKENVNYVRSIPIPGLINTNIAGFSSVRMCPQGIAFAQNYLLVTSYDYAAEENSVIYVMDKTSRKLLTTLVLPSKVHAGGICYDGSNIWITSGKNLAAIPFTQVDTLAQQGNACALINYSKICNLGITASYVAYYNERLWVGSYNELTATNMNSYVIEDKEEDPTLTKEETIIMPTRVQGVAFSNSGYLIMSRSCQTRFGRRGYLCQMDLYRPDFSAVSETGAISLGKCLNTVAMPSMNEGIAINGSYIYVIYESPTFKDATYQMDHICAFKLGSLKKKTVKK